MSLTPRVVLVFIIALTATPVKAEGASRQAFDPTGGRPLELSTPDKGKTDKVRRLHLRGLGLGYDVTKRITIGGGYRRLGSDNPDGASSQSAGFFVGFKRTIGGR